MAMESGQTGVAVAGPRCFAFIFPMASGHINPSLPLARSLVKLGHEVHYLCREQMRGAIEDTGATYHSDVENEPELYEGRQASLFGALPAMQEEYGLEEEGLIVAMYMLKEVMAEMMLPGVIRWLERLRADVVVYCPLLCLEAALAAKVLGIRRVALLTTAGPGSLMESRLAMFATQGLTPEGVADMRRSFGPLRECLARLKDRYGLELSIADGLQPLGFLEAIAESSLTMVTTCEGLQDPVAPELARAYEAANVSFAAVGPLLDMEGARRAAGHRFEVEEGREAKRDPAQRDPVALLREARAAGRKVVLLSMGTVITGDSPEFGWHGRLKGADGRPRGLTGRELCRAAWGAAFDAFGSKESGDGPLLLAALGPQADALGDLTPPPNALCLPALQQVDILKAGVDVFLTHGGQNSFTEALSAGTPLVVCPGFADQPVNARKAVNLGVGLQVERPMPALGQEAAAAEAYRAEVSAALKEVLAAERFKGAAEHFAEQLRIAGGVPRAVALVLEIAASSAVSKEQVGKAATSEEAPKGKVRMAGA